MTGLDRIQVIGALATDEDKDRVHAEVAQAVRIGVSGVPFFIFANAFAVSGAQAADVLASAIDKAREEVRSPSPATMRA